MRDGRCESVVWVRHHCTKYSVALQERIDPGGVAGTVTTSKTSALCHEVVCKRCLPARLNRGGPGVMKYSVCSPAAAAQASSISRDIDSLSVRQAWNRIRCRSTASCKFCFLSDSKFHRNKQCMEKKEKQEPSCCGQVWTKQAYHACQVLYRLVESPTIEDLLYYIMRFCIRSTLKT